MSYVDQHTDPELYTLLVKVVRHPRVGHEVYAAASDALGWTRAFSKAEGASCALQGDVEHELLPSVRSLLTHGEIDLVGLEVLEAKLQRHIATLNDYHSYECQGRAA